MVKITVFWNKVQDVPDSKYRKVLRNEYDIKSSWTVDSDFKVLQRRFRGNNRYTITPSKITEDEGCRYGIHQYTEIVPIGG